MVLILFLRSLLFSLYFYISVIVFTVFFVVISPFIGLKRRYGLTSRYISTLLMVLKFLCRIDWEVRGDILGKKPVVIASNHQGLWESFYLQTLANPLTTIIKKELLYVPFFGWSLNLLNPIKINRSKKIQSAKTVIVSGSQKLCNGFSILLFPEGTRNSADYGPSKFSASFARIGMISGAPIVPVCHNSGKFWINKTFTKNPGTIKVKIGKPFFIKKTTSSFTYFFFCFLFINTI